jgi:transcription initiation factor TFIID TATA-box-binding protein
MAHKIKYQIKNIVAVTSTDEKLDLDLIKKILPNVHHDPKKYNGLVYKISDPKVTVLLNWSGKIIIVGGKSIKSTTQARNIFYEDIKKLGYHPQKNNISIKNIVLLANIETELDLKKIFESNISTNLELEYEMEIFPGLIFKNKEPKFGAVIFKTGKIMIAGLKKMDDIVESIECIQNILKI